MDQNCASLDAIVFAAELKTLLCANDRAVMTISALDACIDQINRDLLTNDMEAEHASICHLRVSVLSGIRHMLDQYRIKKFHQIQILSKTIINSFNNDSADSHSQRSSNSLPNQQTENDESFNQQADDLSVNRQIATNDLDTSAVTMDTAAINYTTLSRECYRGE